MAKGKPDLRPDLHRMLLKLDAAPDRTVVIDKHGDAWQKSEYLSSWYRAFDGDGISNWDLAINADGAIFVHEPHSSRPIEGEDRG